jgi:hypothetical protein
VYVLEHGLAGGGDDEPLAFEIAPGLHGTARVGGSDLVGD